MPGHGNHPISTLYRLPAAHFGKLTSGLGVFSVWMKMERLLVGEDPLTGATADMWLGRRVGRRRVSEAVMAGRRAER